MCVGACMFFYRYMKQKAQTKLAVQKADESDVDSVKSEEFDELVTDIMEGKKDDIDFLSEVGQLPKKDKTKKQDKTSEFNLFGSLKVGFCIFFFLKFSRVLNLLFYSFS